MCGKQSDQWSGRKRSRDVSGFRRHTKRAKNQIPVAQEVRCLLEEPEAGDGRQAHSCPERQLSRSGESPAPHDGLFHQAKNEHLYGGVEDEEKECEREKNYGQRNKTPEVDPPVDGRREERRESGEDGKGQSRPDYDTVS